MAKRLDAKQLVTNVDKLAAEIKNLNVELKQTVEILSKGQSAFNQASKNQNDLAGKTNKVKKATSELEKIQARSNKITLETVRATEKLRQKRKALTDQVKKEQGTFKKSGGLFRSMTKSILAAGVAMLTIGAALRVVKNGLKTIIGFEKGMSAVRAITGATAKEFKTLQENALLLGRTTSKTAIQVAQLQVEFAKLGFSTAEILSATEATIQLSIAAGSDLAEAAVVAASTVRGFGLSASETQRVVDVMAKSFSSSALDMEKFKIAMAKVAPIARASGKSIEFTTAQLGVLSDAGLEASVAGTSLRNIFLELSKQGLTWEEGLEKINTSTNKNNTALQLFGKRSATAGLILADNIKKTSEFEEALNGAAGAAKEMADIMEDNLAGDIDKAKSAWEGFILGLNDGTGALSNAGRAIIKFATDALRSLDTLDLWFKSEKRFTSEDFERIIKNMDFVKTESGKRVGEIIDNFEELTAALSSEELLGERKQFVELFTAEGESIESAISLWKAYRKGIIVDIEIENKAIVEAEAARIEAEKEAARVKIALAEEQSKKQDETTAKNIKRLEKELEEKEKLQLKAIEDSSKLSDSLVDEEIKLSDEEINRLAEQLAKEYALEVAAAQKELKLAEDTAEQKKKVKIAAVEAAEQIVSDRLSIGIDENLAKFQSEQDAASDILKDRLDKGEISEEEYAGKIAEIERKGRIESAKAEKKKAILDATLAAAVSVIKQLAATPLPLGAPFIATAAQIGALQIGVAAAIPIPKFKQGGTMQKDGLAQFSEEGSELAILPSGKAVLTPVEETISMIPKGTEFFKHNSPETQAALSGGISEERFNTLINEQKLTRKAIQKQPKNITNITPETFERSYESGRTRVKFMDDWIRR